MPLSELRNVMIESSRSLEGDKFELLHPPQCPTQQITLTVFRTTAS